MIRPPRLIQSLVGGFNAVANHVYLILLPVALDLLLWFGPRLSLKNLMEPGLANLVSLLRQQSTQDMAATMDAMAIQWKQVLSEFNLNSSLSTFPVGVPSMMAARMPVKTPLGLPAIYEIHSVGQFFLIWLVLTVAGFILGSVYFAGVAQCCGKALSEADCATNLPASLSGAGRVPPFKLKTLIWETFQIILLVILLLGILLVLLVPTLILTTFLYLISPFLAELALLLVSFSAVWFMVPLIFSPHGIFLCGQSVINAMLNSVRVVRHILPGTGIFLLAVIVLNQGLNMLWFTPPTSSWMTLIGIFGHAFVVTGLLAASFIYYRGGLTYMQALRKLIVQNKVS